MSDWGKGFHEPVSSNGSTKPNVGLKPTKQALAQIERTSSLTPIEVLFMRAVKECGETAMSLESQDLEYLLKINEYADIQNYLEQDIQKQIENKQR